MLPSFLCCGNSNFLSIFMYFPEFNVPVALISLQLGFAAPILLNSGFLCATLTKSDLQATKWVLNLWHPQVRDTGIVVS